VPKKQVVEPSIDFEKLGAPSEELSRCLAFAEKARRSGERLKLIREDLAFPQKMFAEMLGLSKRGLQDNEALKTVPGGTTLAALIGLGVNANYVLTGEGPRYLKDLGAGTGIAAEHAPISTEVLGIAVGLLDDLLEAFGDGCSTEDYARHLAEIYDLLLIDEKAVPAKVVEIARYLAKNESRGKSDAISGQGGALGEGDSRKRSGSGTQGQ
jgi:DNA-binding transcriptional regulator YiaG